MKSIAEWKQRPAKGPYTLAMGNSAIYISLPNITSNYSAIVRSVRSQITDGSAVAYAAPGSHATVIEGYKAQLAVLAATFENPNQPVMETPFISGPPGGGFLLHPLRRGTVKINTKNPDDEPVLDYRTASNPIDFDVMATFLEYFRRFYSSSQMQAVGARELEPGPSVLSSDGVREFLRDSVTASFQHPCCTAAMMPKNKGGVVGSDLKVHGITGLSVADLSIIPFLPSAHTSATAYAIGEKVSHSAQRIRNSLTGFICRQLTSLLIGGPRFDVLDRGL
jgi:choline dehydrogenase